MIETIREKAMALNRNRENIGRGNDGINANMLSFIGNLFIGVIGTSIVSLIGNSMRSLGKAEVGCVNEVEEYFKRVCEEDELQNLENKREKGDDKVAKVVQEVAKEEEKVVQEVAKEEEKVVQEVAKEEEKVVQEVVKEEEKVVQEGKKEEEKVVQVGKERIVEEEKRRERWEGLSEEQKKKMEKLQISEESKKKTIIRRQEEIKAYPEVKDYDDKMMFIRKKLSEKSLQYELLVNQIKQKKLLGELDSILEMEKQKNEREYEQWVIREERNRDQLKHVQEQELPKFIITENDRRAIVWKEASEKLLQASVIAAQAWQMELKGDVGGAAALRKQYHSPLMEDAYKISMKLHDLYSIAPFAPARLEDKDVVMKGGTRTDYRTYTSPNNPNVLFTHSSKKFYNAFKDVIHKIHFCKPMKVGDFNPSIFEGDRKKEIMVAPMCTSPHCCPGTSELTPREFFVTDDHYNNADVFTLSTNDMLYTTYDGVVHHNGGIDSSILHTDSVIS
ncbi:hypothetical protein Fsol_00636 [Candidatus Fokinia solitaria]|uniref:Uncharacterized protein n=1 Tax=Candidatus Fokinia solitaria TaxID=1802984 RepID=A0A2U8BSY0_9RICK|nr:hypothetical protein [Candidatus Fokinia solitaria]AWD33415.1 hypothetical protein Fsol_00636 [Candidatus Fokinia solitaria]